MRTAQLLLALSLLPLAAQAVEPYAEVRGYPAGGIFSAGLLFDAGNQYEWGVSALYNRAERGNNGKHDNESGDGFGGGIEARRFHNVSRSGWFYGVRAELFQLDIDWRDPGRSGSTDIVVLQPTARLGYRFFRSGAPFSVELAGGLGAEINLDTKGEKVGEGAIGLFGIAIRSSR